MWGQSLAKLCSHIPKRRLNQAEPCLDSKVILTNFLGKNAIGL